MQQAMENKITKDMPLYVVISVENTDRFGRPTLFLHDKNKSSKEGLHHLEPLPGTITAKDLKEAVSTKNGSAVAGGLRLINKILKPSKKMQEFLKTRLTTLEEGNPQYGIIVTKQAAFFQIHLGKQAFSEIITQFKRKKYLTCLEMPVYAELFDAVKKGFSKKICPCTNPDLIKNTLITATLEPEKMQPFNDLFAEHAPPEARRCLKGDVSRLSITAPNSAILALMEKEEAAKKAAEISSASSSTSTIMQELGTSASTASKPTETSAPKIPQTLETEILPELTARKPAETSERRLSR